MTRQTTFRIASLLAAVLAVGPVTGDSPESSNDSRAALLLAQSSRLFGGEPESSMQVDLVPGSADNTVNPSQGRSIIVAVLGSKRLDVGDINPRTLRLKGADVLLVGKSDKSLCRQQDINGDGLLDLVCEMRTTGFRVEEGEYRILIEAETYDKASLKGEDRLRVVRD